MIKLVDYSENPQPFNKYHQKIEKTKSGQGILEYALVFSLVILLLIVFLW